MKHITQILIDEGFEVFRYVYNKGSFSFVPCVFKNDYSSMVRGGLDYRFVKGSKVICYGLHEANKPPTLIYPRPKGIQNDDQMNVMLMGDNYKIYEAIV